MSTTIGPYEFTEQDRVRTLGHGLDVIDLLTAGRPAAEAAVVAPFRAEVATVLAEVAPEDPDVALERVWGSWRAAIDALRSAGAFGPSAVGTVAGLFRSDGGVPKAAVEVIDVDHGGVVGDRQDDRDNHGRPWQALCLWSTECVDSFRAEGHPLAPGLAGENISLTGLDWTRVRPGVHLQLGDVLVEVSSYAVPCAKNAAWFTGGRFDAMHHRNGPRSRVYATVLEPGTLTIGAPVLLEPGA